MTFETRLRMFAGMVAAGVLILLVALVVRDARAADTIFPNNLVTHYQPMQTVPSSPTDLYTQSVWLKSIEFVPQSTTSPKCTVQDKAGSPNLVYNGIQLSPNTSYRDTRTGEAPLFMQGGITWSCTDSSVKAQIIVMF